MIKIEDNNFFKYEAIGEFKSDGEWIHPSRVIESYEIIFVIDGTVFIEEDGINYELGTNEFLILEPGKHHSGTKNSTAAFYWFYFQTDLELAGKHFKGDEYYDLKYLLRKLLHVTNSHTYPGETADALGLLVFCEYKSIAEKAAVGNSALVERIDEYIRINAKNDISVSAVAERFDYNSDYIGRLYKRSRGIGLKEHIASERMKAAKDLLLTTGLSVKEIAAVMHFHDENLFIKFFMYHEEISPTRFRNKYTGVHLNNS